MNFEDFTLKLLRWRWKYLLPAMFFAAAFYTVDAWVWFLPILSVLVLLLSLPCFLIAAIVSLFRRPRAFAFQGNGIDWSFISRYRRRGDYQPYPQQSHREQSCQAGRSMHRISRQIPSLPGTFEGHGAGVRVLRAIREDRNPWEG